MVSMDTQTRIRLFAGSTVALLAVITGLGLSTNAGRHSHSGSGTPATAMINEQVIGDDAGEAN